MKARAGALARASSGLDSQSEQDTLTSWGAVCRHQENRAKVEGYRRLCEDLGIDAAALCPTASSWDPWHDRPRLIHAEQPGNWLYPDDVLRSRLLSALKEEGDFDRRSGPLCLSNDAFGHRGWKRFFIQFYLGFGLGPVSWVGSPFSRRHQGCSYASLRISGTVFRRFTTILDICQRLLSAAESSPRSFVREAGAILNQGAPDGLRKLLPPKRDRSNLEALSRSLEACDLDRALTTLRVAQDHLLDGAPWTTFWNRVNGHLLGTEVGRLESVCTPFVMAIQDPFHTARALAGLTTHRADEPIALAGLVTDDDHYRLVCCDPAGRRLFLRGTSRADQPISWSKVRERAAAGQCGGPSPILKYLLMAARGLYVVADPLDGNTSFERQISRIHRQYTGLCFPWISMPKSWPLDWPGSFLNLYHSNFDDFAQYSIDEFFKQ